MHYVNKLHLILRHEILSSAAPLPKNEQEKQEDEEEDEEEKAPIGSFMPMQQTTTFIPTLFTDNCVIYRELGRKF